MTFIVRNPLIMKLVTAIIKPQQVDNVKEDLNKLGIHGLTATDVKGFGRQKGHTEFYRGSEFEVAFLGSVTPIRSLFF